ncbi:MAG: hypothetical protein AB1705_23700 [Verrucomicrobiota bacterium]
MKLPGIVALSIALLLAGCAHQRPASPTAQAAAPQSFTTPKLDILNKQIEMSPSNSQAYSNRGYTLALLGRKEAARADLRKALELTDTAAMHNRAGWAYFNMEDFAEALRVWEIGAEKSNRRSHYDYYSLVLGYWGVGNTQKAVENYHLAVERDPRFGEYKTLQERTAEWTPLERRAMHDIYILWSKTWRP